MSVRSAHAVAESVIFDYIVARHPEQAHELTKWTSTVIIGLSTKVRQRQSLEKLLSTARMASAELMSALSAGSARTSARRRSRRLAQDAPWYPRPANAPINWTRLASRVCRYFHPDDRSQ
jgi:hypothetical protein